jgi:GNAT superfamily N-acetyltransferase
MIELIPLESLSQIHEQRERYISGLPYAQELYAEELVWNSRYFMIMMDSTEAGYFCVDSKKMLTEFYLENSALAFSQEIFRFLIDKDYIVAAESKTFDHLLMSLCLDFHKKAACSAYLFRDVNDTEHLSSGSGDICFRLARKEDINSISEISGDFFYDLHEHISKEEVLIFYDKDELIGAGSCKRIWDSKNYYDIGMVVAENHRKKGIGTFIISQLKEYCYNNGLVPVCGCWYYNHASKKTLEKAGFVTRHRIIRFEF